MSIAGASKASGNRNMPSDAKGSPSLLNAPPYSKAVLRLCQRIKDCKSREERTQLMVQLAKRFHQEHDATDTILNDQYHDFFEEYERAQLQFQQAALRLARLALSEVDETFDANDLTIDEVAGTDGEAVN